MKRINLFSLFLFPIFVGGLSGCGTLSSRYQKVPVASDESAEIVVGSVSQGRTNQFLELKRQRGHRIHLKSGDKTQVLKVESSFRWNESFTTPLIASLFFPPLLPVSLLVDFLDGSAWNLEPPDKVYFKKRKEPSKLSGIIILPPLANQELMSEELRYYVDEYLMKKYGSDFVIDPNGLYGDLEMMGATYNSRPEYFRYYDIIDKYKNSHFLETRTERSEDVLFVHTQLIDAWTQERIQQDVSYIEMKELESSTWAAWLREQFYQAFPNSAGIEYQAGVKDKDLRASSYGGNRTTLERKDLGGLISRNLSLRLTNSRHHKQRNPMSFSFQFVPTGFAAIREFRLGVSDSTFSDSIDVRILQLGFGFGPELRFDAPFGTISFASTVLVVVESLDAAHSAAPNIVETHPFTESRLSLTSFLTDNWHVRYDAGVKTVTGVNWGKYSEKWQKNQDVNYDSPKTEMVMERFASIVLLFYFSGGTTTVKDEVKDLEKTIL